MRTPKNTVKVRRVLPKVGEERLLRAKIVKVIDGDRPELVLEIDGLMVYAPVRVREENAIKPD